MSDGDKETMLRVVRQLPAVVEFDAGRFVPAAFGCGDAGTIRRDRGAG
jgi:hypothetical protein